MHLITRVFVSEHVKTHFGLIMQFPGIAVLYRSIVIHCVHHHIFVSHRTSARTYIVRRRRNNDN